MSTVQQGRCTVFEKAKRGNADGTGGKTDLSYGTADDTGNVGNCRLQYKPHGRLTESGVELRLREMGKKLGVEKVHPHKFRRTMATR